MQFLQKQTTVRFLMTLLLIILVTISMFGEKVAMNHGLGWDGQWYFAVCHDFLHNIFNHTYDSYRLQRILPFAIINIVLNVLGIEPTISVCTNFINILNFFMIIIGVFTFMKISDHLKLKLPIEIFGFSALFLNYPILKLVGYYPFLTDTFALSIAICMLYFFICKQKIPIYLIIIGSFTWPTLMVMGLILKYMPSQSIIKTDMISQKDKIEMKLLKVIITLSVPLSACLLIADSVINSGSIMKFKAFYSGEFFKNLYMLAISLICVSIYFWYMLRPIILVPSKQVKIFLNLLELHKIMAFIAIFLYLHALINFLSNGTELVSTWQMIIMRLIIPPTVDPFNFIVTSFMYYGPCILFLLFYWGNVLNYVNRMGYSYFILIMMGVIMLINTESRHLTTFLPMFIIPVLKYLNESQIDKMNITKSLLFLISSILISRCWYHINVPGIETAFANGWLMQFPAQRYFMSQGPWMSHHMYFVFLIITLVFAGTLILSHKYFLNHKLESMIC